MKKLNFEHFFVLSEILDKMDIELPAIDGKTQQEFGLELAYILARKAHKAKDEIGTLIKDLADKEIKEMSIKELIQFFKDLFKDDGFLDFFT